MFIHRRRGQNALTAAISVDQVGKTPDVAQADGVAETGEEELGVAAPLFLLQRRVRRGSATSVAAVTSAEAEATSVGRVRLHQVTVEDLLVL